MKPQVLFATQDRQVWQRLRGEMADLCRLKVSASPQQAYAHLREQPFRVFIMDSKLPRLDSLELVHALYHAPTLKGVFVSWGPLDRALFMLGAEKWEQVMLRRSFLPLVGTLRGLVDPAASRTLETVRYQLKEDAFYVAFRNGRTYEMSRKDISADDGSRLVAEPRIIHGGSAFEVRQGSGNTYRVPWDLVLYHHEPSYPYHKGESSRREAEANRAERIGTRIRREREARDWSLRELARRTGMQPPNLSRLENGRHMPSLETLERVAEALGMRVANLVAA